MTPENASILTDVISKRFHGHNKLLIIRELNDLVKTHSSYQSLKEKYEALEHLSRKKGEDIVELKQELSEYEGIETSANTAISQMKEELDSYKASNEITKARYEIQVNENWANRMASILEGMFNNCNVTIEPKDLIENLTRSDDATTKGTESQIGGESGTEEDQSQN